MRRSKSESYAGLLILLLLLISTAIYFLWKPAQTPTSIEREIVKFLFQLGLIVIIGGAAAVWSKDHWEREIRQRDALREEKTRERERFRELVASRATIYRDYMTRVGSAYRAGKSIRRKLRADGLWKKAAGVLPIKLTDQTVKAYAEQMSHLNEVQLRLEELKMEAKHHPELRDKEELYRLLRDMEGYLRDITSEYEETMSNIHAGNQVLLSDLKHLDEFTDSSDAKGKQTERQFEKHFASAYGSIARQLAGLLAAPEKEVEI